MDGAAAARLHVNYAHYREGTLGTALQQALETLVSEGALSEVQAVAALQQFDISMNKQLAQQETADPMFVMLSGSIRTYRNAENVWSWRLDSAQLKFGATEAAAKKTEPLVLKDVRVVATDAFPGRVSARAARKKKPSAPKPEKKTKKAKVTPE